MTPNPVRSPANVHRLLSQHPELYAKLREAAKAKRRTVRTSGNIVASLSDTGQVVVYDFGSEQAAKRYYEQQAQRDCERVLH